jgi:hypothetical protein
MRNETTMTLEQFAAEFEALQDEGRDKEAALLAGFEPELYARYFTEVLGEDL